MSEEAGAEPGSQTQEECPADEQKPELEAEEGGEVDDEAKGGDAEVEDDAKGGDVDDDHEAKGGEAEVDAKGGEVDDGGAKGGEVGGEVDEDAKGGEIAKGGEVDGDAKGGEPAEEEQHEQQIVEADEEGLTLGGGAESVPAEGKEEEGAEGATAAPPAGAAELEVLHNPQCIFCKIASKEQPAQILYEDSQYVCFWDNRPAATHHYLVIPKTHAVRDPKALTAEHVPVVERMVEIGKQVLTGQGGSVEGSRIGFHWPPVVWVKHLHLHVIGPESSMSWFNRKILYRLDSFAFVTHTWMVQHLKTLQ